MDVYTTESEQVEQVKRWIKSYALPVVIGVVTASALVFGWRYWDAKVERASLQASGYYEQMQIDIMQKNAAGMIEQAQFLLKEHADTPYAKLAAFVLAKQAVERGDLPAAAKQLQWVVDNAKDISLKQLAKMRLARVQLAQDKADDALKTLKKVDDTSFIASVDDIRGDAYVALKQTDKAQAAYQAAVKAMPEQSPMAAIVQMKLNQLAQPTTSKEAA